MSLAIRCSELTRRFGSTVALDDFSLEVPRGTILSLLGPSGCGKTTALRVIAGFESPDAGSVAIGERVVVGPGVDVAPEHRRVGMVFQDYALFPHLSVRANVAYGRRGEGADRAIAGAIKRAGLVGLEDRMPNELSGGEQQRVALARALVPEPDVVLLDEPFSNLDASLRDRMRREVRRILKAAGATAIIVTHDQEEALAVSDVVAVMREGRVEQVGEPHEIYSEPATPWIAGFLGDSVFVDGEVSDGAVATVLGSFPYGGPETGRVRAMARPEWIHPIPDTEGSVTVIDREFYGHDQMLQLELEEGQRVLSRFGPTPVLSAGERVSLAVDRVIVYPG